MGWGCLFDQRDYRSAAMGYSERPYGAKNNIYEGAEACRHH